MPDFDEIYSVYFKEVYKFVFSLCRNHSLAEEVTEETFFKALLKIDGFKGDCKIGTWLCKIAKNTYFDYVKKHKRQTELNPDTASDDDIAKCFEDSETAYLIHKALHKLKEPYKEVFGLRVLGEMEFSKIAALFGKSESWARVTCYRAKIMIKEELK